jgi:hypothetical protein
MFLSNTFYCYSYLHYLPLKLFSKIVCVKKRKNILCWCDSLSAYFYNKMLLYLKNHYQIFLNIIHFPVKFFNRNFSATHQSIMCCATETSLSIYFFSQNVETYAIYFGRVKQCIVYGFYATII